MRTFTVFLADRFVKHLTRFGQVVSVYGPADVTLPDGNVVAAVPALLGSDISATVVKNQPSQDAANAVGIVPALASFGYFSRSVESIVRPRGYVCDASGVYWLIHGQPNTNPLDVTVDLEVLLEMMLTPPNGLP